MSIFNKQSTHLTAHGLGPRSPPNGASELSVHVIHCTRDVKQSNVGLSCFNVDIKGMVPDQSLISLQCFERQNWSSEKKLTCENEKPNNKENPFTSLCMVNYTLLQRERSAIYLRFKLTYRMYKPTQYAPCPWDFANARTAISCYVWMKEQTRTPYYFSITKRIRL